MVSEEHERRDNEFKERPMYDGLYSTNPSAFGGTAARPDSFVEKLPGLLPAGTVLELGAGQGRNALWLARRGFVVEATDLSAVGVAQMVEAARAESLPLSASVADARDPILKTYDAIIAAYVLHHIPTTEARDLIRRMQLQTAPGGYNIVAAFTTDGNFYAKNPATPLFYCAPRELKELYSGWEVVVYEESVKKALATAKDGTLLYNTVARIIARKK